MIDSLCVVCMESPAIHRGATRSRPRYIEVLQGARMRCCARSNVKGCQALNIVVNLYNAFLYLMGIGVDLTDECVIRLRCQVIEQGAPSIA